MRRTDEEYAAMQLALAKELMKEEKSVLVPKLARLIVAVRRREDTMTQHRTERDALKAKNDLASLAVPVAARTEGDALGIAANNVAIAAAAVVLEIETLENNNLLLERDLLEAPKKMARSGARAKLAIDPKQKEKTIVRECWDDWQKNPLDRAGKPKYKGKAAFARDMLTKYESLVSNAVITGWCLDWERETITLPAR